MSFLDDVIYDFSQIDFDISVTVGLHIEDAALGIILVNQIEKIIKLIVRELLFQLLRQIVFDVLNGLFIIEIILQKIVFQSHSFISLKD